MPICRVENITKEYIAGKVISPALRGVTTNFEKGEFTVLAGPSGSGKTTLLNLIGCLDKPTSGEIFLEDQQVKLLNSFQAANIRNKNIGFIFQSYNLIPTLTAFENVELPLLLKGIKNKTERKNLIEDALFQVGLKDFINRKPNELSGGQQQRVAIARALVKEPLLVLADEPTANLDSKTGEEILIIMKNLNEQQKMTFIFSSHDKMVIEYSRRKIYLHDGKIVND